MSTVRGNLGAVQNRLEHTTASISVASENLYASMSRIKDLDVASEMVNFTKTQILQQAGTAILAQANLLRRTSSPCSEVESRPRPGWAWARTEEDRRFSAGPLL